MELENSRRPRSYYLREVVNKKGEVELLVEDQPEIGEVYITREVIGKEGVVHIIFWKKSNFSVFV